MKIIRSSLNLDPVTLVHVTVRRSIILATVMVMQYIIYVCGELTMYINIYMVLCKRRAPYICRYIQKLKK